MLVFSLEQTVHPNTMSSFAVLACSTILWLTMVPPSSAQPGFINIDCGATEGFTSTTNLTWVIDTGYISTGEVATLPNPYNNLSLLVQTVRYFPKETIKSCYELSPVIVGVGYIVRAGFYYGDYDRKGTMPTFSLIIDATVMVDGVIDNAYYDMYVRAKSTSISVCLARSVSASLAGDPFISYLQVLTIPSGTSYDTVFDNGYGLYSIYTVDLGSNRSSGLRYPNDTMDRIWTSFTSLNNSNLETVHEVKVDNIARVDYAPPIVLQTATTGSDLPYPLLTGLSSKDKYHIIFFFAEINPNVTAPGQRVFDIYSNVYKDGLEPWADNIDVFNSTGGQFKGLRLYTASPVTPVNDSILVTFRASPNSTYGPIISGIQVLLYTDQPLSNLTYLLDVSAIKDVRDVYQIQGWNGDPCMPMNYSWSWIRCAFSPPPTKPRISSIILSQMKLTGIISKRFKDLPELTEIYLDRNQLTGPIPDLSSLSNLQTLDLRDNNLSGTIPNWLGSLSSLKELFLQNNKFEGDVPHALLEKAAQNKLNFTYGGNTKLTCNGQSCDVLTSQPSPPSPPPSPPFPPPSPSSSAPTNISILFTFFSIHIMLSFFIKPI